MALQSKELIGKLVGAEEQAEKIIKSARDLRSQKMKDLKVTAEEELKPYKAQAAAKHEADAAALAKSGNVHAELEKVTQAELAAVKADFDKQKGNGARYVLEKVLSIDLSVPENIKQSIGA